MAARHGLGRGLDALIKDNTAKAASQDAVQRIPVESVQPSPWQPRHEFEPAALAELTASVRERGILQPLLVRRVGQTWQLLAGERRLRAARAVGLKEVPVIELDVSDLDALAIALIENLQRKDLNVLEEAEGYHTLASRFGLTQEDIAQRVGKARASVANALRLLQLPQEIRLMIADGRLSPGHAKVIASLAIEAEQLLYARRSIDESLSVRQLEKLIEKSQRPPRGRRSVRTDIPADHLKFLTDSLHQRFGTSVRITPTRTYANGRKAKGCVEIDFYSNDDLDRILEIVGGVEA